MQNRVLNNPKIEIMWNTEIEKITGNSFVESIIIKNNIKEIKLDGLEKSLDKYNLYK